MASNGHGGARPGAGRKPKALRYAPAAEMAEQQIVDALPAIIDNLIAFAKGGDVASAKYLCDRILGRVATVERPPALDTALPYEEADFEQEQRRRDLERRRQEFEQKCAAENLEENIALRPARQEQARSLERLIAGLGP